MIKDNLFKDFLIVFLIFLLDRVSKFYVIFFSKKNNNLDIYTSKYLNIDLYWNKGIAFGLLSFSDKTLYNLLNILIFIVIIIVLIMIVKANDFRKYPLIMILGGAIGNFFDRIVYQAVPDFIDFHINNFHWFIFNVADIFISIGVIFMILIEIVAKKKRYE
tara:strand:+ start:432 stop:914 length:483 start_codon:yes stop_codon:yes gene_type:complete